MVVLYIYDRSSVYSTTPKMNSNGNGKRNGRKPANGNQNVAPKRKRQPNGNALQASAISYSGAVSNSRPVINSIQTMSGSDFFSTVEVQPNVSGIGRIIAKVPISPSQFPGTRLTQLSNLWEFFKFTKFHLRWVPAVPTTLACQFVLYIDLDPSDDPTIISDEDALIRQAVAQTGAQQWNFHVPKTIPLAMRSDRQYYFTGVDKQNVRFSQQGAAYLIQITNPINFNGENISSVLQAGSLFFDWTVNFSTPQLNPSAAITATQASLAVSSRLTSINILPDIVDGSVVFTISGFTPRQYYVMSLNTRSTGNSSTELRSVLPSGSSGVTACWYRRTATDSSMNLSPGDVVQAGFLILQADNSGEVEVIVVASGTSTVSYCRLAYLPLFELAQTGGARVVKTMTLDSSTPEPLALHT